MPRNDHTIDITWASDRHLRIRVGPDNSEPTRRRVLALWRSLREARVPGVVDLTPAYSTVLVTLDVLAVDPQSVRTRILDCVSLEPSRDDRAPSRDLEFPACFEPEMAPDLPEVASHAGLDTAAALKAYCACTFRVAFIGFTPGFAFLSGLPPALAIPRLETPRVRVPAGSIGIAGSQTGIYPHATPGGWRLIGRTPVRLFDAMHATPCLLSPGDGVRFVPIGVDEFRRIQGIPEGGTP